MASTSDLQKIYVGYFGRAADPSGLNYWLDQANTKGMGLSAIATSFSVQDEAKATYAYLAYPSMGLSPKDFLQSVYQNLFNRSLDSDGEKYWTGKLTAPGATIGSVILDIISGAQAPDAAVLNNKVTVAQYYTNKVVSSGATWGGADQAGDIADARAVVKDVGTDASVAAGKSLADSKIAADITEAAPVTYSLSVDAPKVTEGNSGSKELVFTLTLDKAPTADVTVNYVVAAGGTATAGDDFVAEPGSVIFAAGKTAASVTVSVLGDNIKESNETIQLTFTGSKLVASVTATGTITDNDNSPVFTSSAAPSVAENTTTVVQIAATDADGDNVTATISGGADKDLFSLSAGGTLSFNAAPNFEAPADAGKDNTYNLTIRASDIHGNATEQALAIKVTNVNEAPTVAATQAVSGTEDVAATVTVSASDVDGDALTYTAGAASKGTVTGGAGGVFTYTPTANSNGADSFVVTATDAQGAKASQTVNVTVAAVNDAPTVAATQSVSGTEDVAATITVSASDVDGDALTYTAGAASHGTVTGGAGGVFTYTPTANYNGDDSFVVTATDAQGAKASQTVSLTLAAANDAPVAVADAAASVVVGQSVTIDVLANDTDVDGNALSISGTPTVTSGGGSVSVSGNKLVYTAGSLGGSATIAYKITDGTAVVDGPAQIVSIGEAVLSAAAASVNEGQNIVFNIKGAPSTAYAVLLTSSNLAEVASEIVSVTTNASGEASITRATTADRTTEASAQSVSAKILGTQAAATSVSVTDSSKDNVGPSVAATQSVSGTEDTAASITVSATDPEGDALTYSAAAASHGTVTGGTGGVFTYTPTANYNGADSFVVTATDALGAKASQTVSLTVASVNDAPTLTVGSSTPSVAEEGATVVTSVTTADIDTGDTLSAVTITGTDAALFRMINGNLTFNAAPNYENPGDVGGDNIYNVTLNVTDSHGAAASQAVTVTVTDVVETFTIDLTANVDRGAAFTGGVGNDTFQGLTGATTLNALDQLDGGNGVDTLNYVQTAAITVTSATQLANIETVNITGGAAVTVNAAGWTGVTSLASTGVGGADITVAAGANVTITDTAQAGNTIEVDGANNVTVSTSGVTTGTISIGKNASVTGAVNIASNLITGAGASTVTVIGGSTVSVTQSLAAGAVNTIGAVAVTNDGSLTSVSASAVKGEGATITYNTVGVTGIGDATTADTITSITASGYTTFNSIQTNALSNLSLSTGSGNIIIDNSAAGLSTTTLALSVNGLTGGTLDDADIYTKLNITSTGTASTLANITTGSVTDLTLAGDKKLTLTSVAGLGKVASIDATAATGGMTISSTLLTSTDYDGGSGVDTITLGATTKGITTGGGNDVVTLSAGTTALGTGGSIDAGDGTGDTLSFADADDATTASGGTTFETHISNFEKVNLAGAAGAGVTVNLANLDDISKVNVAVDLGQTLAVSNIASGGTVTYQEAQTAASTITVDGAVAGTSDVLNIEITSAVAKNINAVTASNVETINFLTDDTASTSTGIEHVASLTAAAAKTMTVAGDAGLTLTFTGTALTSFDASAVTDGDITWTSGALAAAATIKGGATSDANVIVLSAALDDIIYTGGSGTDTITMNHASNHDATTNSFTLGNGANTLTASNNDGDNTVTGGTGVDTISLGNGTNSITTGNGADVITVGTGANTIDAGAGSDTITIGASTATSSVNVGTGTDAIVFTGLQTSAGAYVSLTGMDAGDTIDFSATANDAGGLASGVLGAKLALGGAASWADYLNAATADVAGSTDSAFRWFQYGGNTYLTLDNSNATTFQSGVDQVVELIGLVSLATSTQDGSYVVTLV